MRILHVAQPTTAGVARAVSDCALRQRDLGFEVGVACPPSGDLPKDLRRIGVNVYQWHAIREPRLRLVREVLSLHRIVKDFAPDVVHLHSAKASLVGRLALRSRVPTVVEPNGWSFLAGGPMMGRAALLWERVATRWTQALVLVSMEEKRIAERAAIDTRNALVLPNGIDGEMFPRVGDADRARAREYLGLEPDCMLVVCVGRLCEQKGQAVLLSAWPAVLDAVPGARLRLVGDGPYRETLERVVGDDASIAFVGHSTDVIRWYAAANVVVLPSRWEGMSFVMLEAASAGRQLVVSDVPGARELFPSEDAWNVVPADDVTRLTDALITALADGSSSDARGRLLADRVRRHFRASDRHERIVRLYREMIRG